MVSEIWVAPLEIGHCLLEHPDVLECAVVVLEKESLTIPRAWVVLSSGSQPSEATAMELQGFVRSRLSPHKYPKEVRLLKKLPKTAGKLERKALKACDQAPVHLPYRRWDRIPPQARGRDAVRSWNRYRQKRRQPEVYIGSFAPSH